MTKKLMIVDLMNLAFRSYHGFARNAYLSNAGGKPTFVCYGLAMLLNRLLRDYQPEYVLIATDGGGKTFRHDMYPLYKSGRSERPIDFTAQLDDMYAMLDAYGFKVVRKGGVEADDVIGAATSKFASDEVQAYVVSGDKDFMQLVDKNTFLVRPTPEGYQTMGAEAVLDKFGVRPDQVIDAQAIIGDAADAVPGVKGIGEKGAAKLIKSFGTLEAIYENLAFISPALGNKLLASRDMAFLSKKLVTIDKTVPLDFDLEALKAPIEGLRRPELVAFFEAIGFKSMIQGVDVGNEIPEKFLTTFQ